MTTTMTGEQTGETLQRFADGLVRLPGSPVLDNRSECGLDYEDVTFPARAGIPLGSWLIPAPGSSGFVIASHTRIRCPQGSPRTCRERGPHAGAGGRARRFS